MKQAALAARPDDTEALEAVASSRIWLGLVARVRGEPRKALALFDAALTTQLALQAARPGEFVRLHDLGILQVRRAEALRDLGDVDAASDAMDAAAGWLGQAVANDQSNRYWQAERANAEAGRLIAHLDAGLPVGDALPSLVERVTRAEQGSGDYLWGETAARLVAIQAMVAAQRADWPATLAALTDASRHLQALVAARPLNWQLSEFRARLALLYASVPDVPGRTPTRTATCATQARALQPSVDSGQAGLVQEAWLATRACSGAGQPDAMTLQRLTAGGYRQTPTNQPTHH